MTVAPPYHCTPIRCHCQGFGFLGEKMWVVVLHAGSVAPVHGTRTSTRVRMRLIWDGVVLRGQQAKQDPNRFLFSSGRVSIDLQVSSEFSARGSIECEKFSYVILVGGRRNF